MESLHEVPDLTAEETARLPYLQLLTAKPVLYVCNVAELDAASGNDYSQQVADKAAAEGAAYVIVSAAIESEIAQLDNADKAEFLGELGLDEAGLSRLIRAGYGLLNLLTLPSALRRPALGQLQEGQTPRKPLG